MVKYILEIEHESDRDELFTEKVRVMARGKTLDEARDNAMTLLKRFKSPIVLYEYEDTSD